MRFPEPLVQGALVRRYKRFLADVRLDDGTLVTAHCTNTGTLRTCCEPGWRVGLSRSPNPKRKCPFTWEVVSNGLCWIGINTLAANRLAEEAVRDGRIPELSGYEVLEREKPYGENSRIDLRLRSPGRPDCYVEVKNVTMKAPDGSCCFPDAVTLRGRKHLAELAAMVSQGCRAVMLFVIQRPDAGFFRPAWEVDPDYGHALRAAMDGGVEALAYMTDVSPEEIVLRHRLPVRTDGYGTS